MNEKPPGRQYFWPALFLAAFVFGTLLWALWMYQVVKKTRNQQRDGFFVPREGGTIVVAPATNPPPARTN